MKNKTAAKICFFIIALTLNPFNPYSVYAMKHSGESENPDNQSEVIKTHSNSDDLPINYTNLENAIFVGDSLTLKLMKYTYQKRQQNQNFFKGCEFLCAGGFGSAQALAKISNDTIHPKINGQQVYIEEAIPKIGLKKTYILLGTNDLSLYGADGAAHNLSVLISKMLKNSPDLEIYIQSVTPIAKGWERRILNNSTIEKYNKNISDLCKLNGYHFIDIASDMKDEEGFLSNDLCSDLNPPYGLGLHLNNKACDKWIKILNQNT